MAKDKEKKEDVPETDAPTSEPADESVEVAENPQNKMDEIEDADLAGEILGRLEGWLERRRG